MSMIKPGMFIGDRYEIIEKIGSGGMADVYRAKCHRLNRFVAIKILKPEYSSDKNFVTKFRGEAQSCAGLTHPNIVSVFDVGDDGDLHYIVMELVEGITLKRFIERKGRLSVKDAVGIAIQIAQGLDAAHQNHVIHRDIKPQNIIISREGKVKVADFGIAKAASSNTINQNAIGSVHYLSPEQARGGYSDERSDIYSLGVTMYEMLTGRVPFAGDNSVSVALLHIQGEATPLRELNPDVTPSLEKIVQKCMQKKPERRYLTATELIHDLKASIMNPTGDFVKVAPAVVTDSPTRMMTDQELGVIKSAPKGASFYEDEDETESPHRLQKEGELDEDEELDGVSSKTEKLYLIGSILVVVILVGCILALVLKFFGIFDSKGGDITTEGTPTPTITTEPSPTPKTDMMPNVTKKDFEAAKAQLEALGLELDIRHEPSAEGNSDYPEGIVLEQNPAEGAILNMGDRVTLTVNIGPGTTLLEESLIGLTREQIETVLGDYLVLRFKYEASEDIPEECVVRTDPAIGTEVQNGSTITVYLCSGKIYSVPNVLGKTQAEAEQMIRDAGLTFTTDDDYSSTVPAGSVISQSPTEGKQNSAVTVELIISLGPEPTPSPTPTPMPEDPSPTPIPEDPSPTPEGPTPVPEDQTEG